MEQKNIFIAGAGGIGKAAGLILAVSRYLPCNIILGDRYMEVAQAAAKYINDGAEKEVATAILLPETGVNEVMALTFQKCDIILDCLPGSLAPRYAAYAKEYNCHYANLTEYVAETNQVTEIANGASSGFMLQTGLAPGYINVLGMHLFNKFTSTYNVSKVDSLDMKVGALSKYARSPYYYAFTWSPIGVATEYVEDAVVVKNYQTQKTPSLSDTQSIIIDGDIYEDDFTSGGAADLPTALEGRVKNLSYKTLRYPGHYDWAKKIISSTPLGSDTIEHLQKTMLETIPSVEEDLVVVFASVRGNDETGRLRALQKSIKVYPTKVGTKPLRAIQTTTAAPLCEAARMLLQNTYQGPVFQSQIDPVSFLNGPFVKEVYGSVE